MRWGRKNWKMLSKSRKAWGHRGLRLTREIDLWWSLTNSPKGSRLRRMTYSLTNKTSSRGLRMEKSWGTQITKTLRRNWKERTRCRSRWLPRSWGAIWTIRTWAIYSRQLLMTKVTMRRLTISIQWSDSTARIWISSRLRSSQIKKITLLEEMDKKSNQNRYWATFWIINQAK